MNPLKKLVLVDDDEVFVFLTTKAIEQTNLAEVIKVFGNGLDALDFIKENANNPDSLPEVIFLDLSMPIMDGWQFLEEYVMLNPKIGKSIVIYICTSSISPDDIIKAKEIGAVTDFIMKPIPKDRLLEILKNL
jgi:CheY-like chemotaxis protein